MDPMGEVLYVSDTSSRRVYRVRNLGQPKDPSRNMEVVAGTGEQCLPFDQSHCGEGRKATEAALNNPRGRKNTDAASEQLFFLSQFSYIILCDGWLVHTLCAGLNSAHSLSLGVWKQLFVLAPHFHPFIDCPSKCVCLCGYMLLL